MSPRDIRSAFDEHAAALVLYARQWLGPGSAEDVVQNVFLKLIRRPPSPDRLRAWLFRCVRNASLNELRSLQRRRRQERQFAGGRTAWFLPAPEGRLDAETVQALLTALSEQQRELVVLRIWGQLTLEQISEIVGQPVSTLWSRYRAALKHMRARLENACPAESL
jgi:RNA polymerase sigma factor (sigma-70 family)